MTVSHQNISVGKLLLNVANYRIVKQTSQKGAIDAIVSEQGRKLVKLAEDILLNGLNPADLPVVIDAEDGDGNFIVIEGNRRLTSIMLLLNPELAKETPIHAAFVKQARRQADAIPKMLYCAVASTRAVALQWADRKHANGLQGAGTEPWTAMSKARAEADANPKSPPPALDAINFVLANATIDAGLRHHLEGSQFKLTTLERLVTTKELQAALGMKLDQGRLTATTDRKWAAKVLADAVKIIHTGKHGSERFTERSIDSDAKRAAFVHELIAAHPGRKAAKSWAVTGTAKAVTGVSSVAKKVIRSTASTDDQATLIPKSFKLVLPAGKINDVFVELKTLQLDRYRHAASVLFRVFLDFTLDYHIEKHDLRLPLGKTGHKVDSLRTRLSFVVNNVKAISLMTDKELHPIHAAQSDKGSLLAPDTLNAYVHSPWMNPDVMQLKVGWLNIQLFIERIWTEK